MNMEIAKQGVTRTVGRAALLARKYSPELLTGTGIVAGVAAAVLGAKATLKLSEITDKIDEGREIAKHRAESSTEYATTEYRKDIRHIYAQGTVDIVRLYAPSVGLGVVSVTCVLGAHGVMRRRNAALAAAYISLQEAYNNYRKRVQEEVGEEKELKIWLGETTVEIPDEDNKPMALTTIDPRANPYGRWFDEGSTQFSREPGWNARLLLAEQNYFNDRLKSRGYVFLNEVYHRLGLPDTREGQVVGWYYDKNNPEIEGIDDYIDFGIMNPDDPGARDFINGWNKAVWLDFNVQGLIQNLI